MREAIEELHRPVGVGRERPGDPAGQLAERQVDKTEQERQPAQDHHGGLDGQDEGVGDQRDQRNTPELVGHDREGGQLGGQGEEQEG